MGPPSRARARRHRVLVVWLGVLLLTQRSISTTAAPRRVNHTNNTNNTKNINNFNNINTYPTPNDSQKTSQTPNDSRNTNNAAKSDPSDSKLRPTTHVFRVDVLDVQADNAISPHDSRKTSNATTLNPSDSKLRSTADVIAGYVTPVLAAVGLAGNAVSIAVWSGEREFNPATFCIKALSVADMVYLSGPLFKLALALEYLYPSYIYGSIFSAHLTLALVVIRWLSVHRPLHVHRLLTKRRTVASLVLLSLWCGALGTLELSLFNGFLADDYYAQYVLRLTLEGVGLVLPILMLAFFNVSLVRFMCRRSHNAGGISPSPSRTEARATQLRRLVAVVVCVSVTTTLTYPVGVVVAGILYRDADYPEETKMCGEYNCLTIIVSLLDLLKVFNSAVTPFYYALIASRFRELFWSRYKSCRAACRNSPCVPTKRPSPCNTAEVSSL